MEYTVSVIHQHGRVDNSSDWDPRCAIRAGLAISFIAVITNILEIVIFLSKELNSRSSRLLACISMFNLLSGLLFLCTSLSVFVQSASKWEYVFRKCAIVITALNPYFTALSGYFVTWLTIERYFCISKPFLLLRRPRYLDCIIVSFVLIVPLAATLPAILAFNSTRTNHAVERPSRVDLLLHSVRLTVLIFGPSLAIAASLTVLLVTLCRKKHKTKLRWHCRKPHPYISKVVVMVALLAMAFQALPRAIVYCLLLNRPEKGSKLVFFSFVLLQLIGYASPDIAVYIAYNKRFRLKLVSLLKACVHFHQRRKSARKVGLSFAIAAALAPGVSTGQLAYNLSRTRTRAILVESPRTREYDTFKNIVWV